MDRKGTDAEGGRGGDRGGDRGGVRGRCAGKLAVVMAVQNVLVLACLLLTFYNYYYKESPQPETIVHIQIENFKALNGNQTLQFSHVISEHRMRLGETKDTIHISCTGPYIWYMNVCYQPKESNGILQLQVEGRGPPVSSVMLNATHDAASNGICRGLHSIVYFRARQVAKVQLITTPGFIYKNVTMGLTYLLGNMCDY